MVTSRFVIQSVVGHLLSLFYGSFVIFGLIFLLIRHPIKSFKALFNKKTRSSPSCLSDTSFGTHGFIHLENVKLHYVASGSEDKPLMLLIHGFPEFWFSWRHQIKEFSKDYRVVAIDMRGYNDSDKPSGYRNYFAQDYINDIKQCISALGHKSGVLVGHDWGGVMLWFFASEFPEMVDRLILLNAPNPKAFGKLIQRSLTQLKMSWYVSFVQLPWLPEFLMSIDDFRFFDMFFNNCKCTPLTKEDVEAYKYCYSKPGGFTGPLNFYRATLKNPKQSEIGNKLISAPTLMIWGVRDFALDKGLPEAARSYASNYTVKYIEEGGHFIQMDTPDKVNKYMREFLSEAK